MDFIILPQYFTLYHLFIQDVSLTHKYIICLCGFCRLESYLYNKFLGNTYVNSSPHLHYFDSIFTLICTFQYRRLQYLIIKYLALYNKYEITLKSLLPWMIIC